jgi:hypothetical protein
MDFKIAMASAVCLSNKYFDTSENGQGIMNLDQEEKSTFWKEM